MKHCNGLGNGSAHRSMVCSKQYPVVLLGASLTHNVIRGLLGYREHVANYFSCRLIGDKHIYPVADELLLKV